jgi:hypothetical protein
MERGSNEDASKCSKSLSQDPGRASQLWAVLLHGISSCSCSLGKGPSPSSEGSYHHHPFYTPSKQLRKSVSQLCATPDIQALRRLKQEDLENEVNLGSKQNKSCFQYHLGFSRAHSCPVIDYISRLSCSCAEVQTNGI